MESISSLIEALYAAHGESTNAPIALSPARTGRLHATLAFANGGALRGVSTVPSGRAAVLCSACSESGIFSANCASLFLKSWFPSASKPTSSRSIDRPQIGDASPAYAGLMQRVVINDLLTQITAVFVTIGGGGASNGSGTRTKTTGNYRVADPRHGPGDAGGARPPGATRLGL